MPLAFISIRPTLPVYPFSKIRGKSSGAMPIPVSRIKRRGPDSEFFVPAILAPSDPSVPSASFALTPPAGVYFYALESTCSTTKSSHFSSVVTV